MGVLLVGLCFAANASANTAGLKDSSLRSGVWIGAAMDSSQPLDQQADLKQHFTALTSENAFKWGEMESTQGQIDWSATDRIVSFAQENHLRLRAHTLFWHRMQNPSWVRNQVQSSANPKSKLFEIMDQRVSQVMGRYKGHIDVWDVINEPLRMDGQGWDLSDGASGPANFFYLAAGEDYIDHAFKAARRADPHAKLFLNEYISRPALDDPKSQVLLGLVARLKARGVPLDGVGLQMHGLGSLISPWFSASTNELRLYIRRLAILGVKVEITEMDISLPAVIKDFGKPGMTNGQHLELQAQLYRQVARACALEQSCSGVTVWGLRDKDSWLNSFVPGGPHRPLLLDDTGLPKPAYYSLAQALLSRCQHSTQRLCSEPWPNPFDLGAPYPGVSCRDCIRPHLKHKLVQLDPRAWKWRRTVMGYSYYWMQSVKGSNRGYKTIPGSKNKPWLRASSGQVARWVKVCLRANNEYGASRMVCTAARGPFR